jgi:hypothetical protein
VVVNEEPAHEPLGRTMSVFEGIARLFRPIDPQVDTVVLEADRDWRVDLGQADDAQSILWGKPAVDPRHPLRMLGWALKRERAFRLAGQRLPRGMRLAGVHRLPPALRPRPWVNPLRWYLLSGGLVRLVAGPPSPTVLETLFATAGMPTMDHLIRPSGDGSVLSWVEHGGQRALMRAAADGTGKDLRRNAAALTTLAAVGLPVVPRLLAQGRVSDVSWTVESLLPGRMAHQLTPALLGDLRDLCIALSRSAAEPISSLPERLQLIGRFLPEHTALLGQLAAEAQPTLNQLPAVLQHGDLWIGNTLVEDGRLSGVIDWDTWHPAGLPGVDMLHLLGLARRAKTGEEVGDLVRARFWEDESSRAATAPYWQGLGVRPDRQVMDVVALDWWARRLISRRVLLSDPNWAEQNAHGVLARLSRG